MGSLQRGYADHPQSFDQPVLGRQKAALDPTLGLGGVGRRPSDLTPAALGRPGLAATASPRGDDSFRRGLKDAGLVGVEHHWPAVALRLAPQQSLVLTWGESCRTKRAVSSLVASSIIWIRYSFSPRPSSQSCSSVSHCTNSPREPRLARHWCNYHW